MLGGAKSYVSIRLQSDAEAASPEPRLESKVLESWLLRSSTDLPANITDQAPQLPTTRGALLPSLRARPSPGCLSDPPGPSQMQSGGADRTGPPVLGVPPAPTPRLVRQQQEDTGRRGVVLATSSLLDLALEMARPSLWLVTPQGPAAMPEFRLGDEVPGLGHGQQGHQFAHQPLHRARVRWVSHPHQDMRCPSEGDDSPGGIQPHPETTRPPQASKEVVQAQGIDNLPGSHSTSLGTFY